MIWSPEPEGQPNFLPCGIPYTRGVRSAEDASKYGVGPANLVPFEKTAWFPVIEAAKAVDSVLCAQIAVYWDHHLLPAVQEAQRVEARILARYPARSKAAEAWNEPILARLAALLKEEAEIRTKGRVAARGDEEYVPKLVADVAKALGTIGQELSGDSLTIDVRKKELHHSIPGIAAGLKLDHNPNEDQHFLKKWVYGGCTIMVGAFFGISYLSGPGVVHPSELLSDPPGLVAGACLGGVAFTTLAGTGMRLVFRLASEHYHADRNWWWGTLTLAITVSSAIMCSYTFVDAIGLMKASDSMAQIAALAGGKPSSSVDPASVIAAGSVSLFYTVYSSVVGWMKGRSTAANQIVRAAEDEQIKIISDTRSQEGFPEAVTAVNMLHAGEVVASKLEDRYAKALASISEERAALLAQLREPREFTEEEVLELEKANTDARGRQTEFLELIEELRRAMDDAPAPENQRSTHRQIDRDQNSARGRLSSWLQRGIARISQAIARAQ